MNAFKISISCLLELLAFGDLLLQVGELVLEVLQLEVETVHLLLGLGRRVPGGLHAELVQPVQLLQAQELEGRLNAQVGNLGLKSGKGACSTFRMKESS